jgi:hypothetical protein
VGTTTLAGVLLLVVPLAFNAAFALLAARFDYPDILRQPSAERCRKTGSYPRLLRRVEVSCQPGAEQRSGGREANGTWKHACADVVAREQACDRIDAVYDGRRFKPAAHGRAAVQGDQQPKSQAEVARTDHAGEEARPALGPVTAGHCAAHQLRRQKRHDADCDPPARQGDRQLPSLHRPDGTRRAIGR